MLKNWKSRKSKRHFCVESREIKTSYTSNNNKMKVWFALFLVKGKRLVKVNYLDCVAIRMLHQIFSEVLNALSISIQGEEMQFAMDSLFEMCQVFLEVLLFAILTSNLMTNT